MCPQLRSRRDMPTPTTDNTSEAPSTNSPPRAIVQYRSQSKPSAGRQDECLRGDQPCAIGEFDACVGAPRRHGRPVDGRVVLAHAADDREPVQVELPAGAGHDELVTLLRPQAPTGAGE